MVLNQLQYVEINQQSILDLFKPEASNTLPFVSLESLKSALVGGLSSIPFVGSILATGVDQIMTQIIEDQNAIETENAFSQFRNSILDAVDEKFVQYDHGSIKNLLSGTTVQMGTLKEYVKQAINNPGKPKYKGYVRTQIQILDNIFVDKVNACRNTANDIHISQLPFYTIMVTQHLSLLSDAVKYSEKWGIPEDIKASYLKKFNDLQVEATKWCMDTYLKGIKKIREKDTTNDVRKFNKLLNYRSQCIFYVFDFFPIWENMDPIKYSDGVNSEACRYIFSEIQGFPCQDSTSTQPYYRLTCEQLENKFYYYNYNGYKGDLKTLALFKQLDNNRYVSIENLYKDNPSNETDIRVGENLGGDKSGLFSYVSTFPDEPRQESVTINSDLIPRLIKYQYVETFPLNSPYYGITGPRPDVDSGNAEQSITYSLPNGYQFPCVQPPKTTKMVPLVGVQYLHSWKYNNYTCSFPNHKIGHVIPLGENNDVNPTGVIDAVMIAFAPVQLFRYNYIYSTGITIIQSSKFVKKDDGVNLSIYNLFDFPTWHLWSMSIPLNKSITYAFDSSNPETAKKFVITVRYTCSTGAKLQITNVATSTVPGTIDLPAGTNQFSTSSVIINIANQSFGQNRFKFTAKLAKVELISISFTPKIETSSAITE